MQRTLIAAVVMSSALLLVGCEDEPEPKFESTPSEAASSATATEPTDVETTDSGPVEPTLPDEAKEPTKVGAEAFVEYYWEVVNYAQQTGEVTQLERIQADYCEPCRGGTDAIRQLYERGGELVGGAFSIVRMQLSEAADGSWLVAATMRNEDQVVRRPNGQSDRFDGGASRHILSVGIVDDAWEVQSWEPPQ